MSKLKNFIVSLWRETVEQGKMLLGYLLVVNPWLTDYPMIVDAIHQLMANPTKQNCMNLLTQAILALGAGHRFVKVLKAVFSRMRNY